MLRSVAPRLSVDGIATGLLLPCLSQSCLHSMARYTRKLKVDVVEC